MIQVNEHTVENIILGMSGASHHFLPEHVCAALQQARPQDWLLMQGNARAAWEAVKDAGGEQRPCPRAHCWCLRRADLTVVLNPMPSSFLPSHYETLSFVHILVVNEHEAADLTRAIAPHGEHDDGAWINGDAVDP